ncbi:glycosyltransferase [Nostoc sp. UIC 10630]|uniref:rhamnosyltransferase WsaF family glycosyltransferase n=1 Tax=Nostoc sp. UIC 10630 TaxID=2100146 RepID=UPI0013D6BB69|nr:glycosyltransferase [Nostoc sp. UIC 10630]NEU83752.1 glycosyltransferase [Nostoc sp. UIC 10630]
MNKDWSKDYPSAENLTEEGLGENHVLRKMLNLIGDNQRVVDFGCATGYFAQLLSRKGCIVTGVEINLDAAKVAEQYCKEVIVADLDFVSVTEILPSQEFDVAVFGDVLEHLRNPWKVLEETKQILKKDGYVIASIPNIAHGAIRLSLLQGKFEYTELGILDNTHLRFFTRETVEELFKIPGYFVNIADRTKLEVFSESSLIPQNKREQFDSNTIKQIEEDKDADTLQFIIRADPWTIEGEYAAISERFSKLLEESEQLKSQLHSTQAELDQAQAQVQGNQLQLERSQSNLQQTQTELERSQSNLQQTQTELERSQSNLQQTQTELERSQSNLQQTQTELERSQSQLRQTQAKLEKSQSELIYAQTSITAMQSSKFWKLRKTWFRVKGFLNLVPASEIFTHNKELNIVNKTEDILKTSNSLQEDLFTDNRLKMFAFISGCPGDSYRYRCHHQAEILKYLGYTVDVYEPMVFLYNELITKYKIIIAHRVPHTNEFEQFVFNAKKLDIKVIFDTDDLVFDPSRISQIHACTLMDQQEKTLYENGVKRYRKSMSLCDYITVSTNKLQQEIQQTFPDAVSVILRNRISDEMEQGAIEARKSYVPNDGMLRIAYFSGTKTHVKDFAECVLALKSILTEFPYVRLMVVGHLDIPEALQEVASQIECVPYMPWRDLPELYRKVDINLAPLEKNNDFTESKSELKYFEAALLSVPTIASDTSAFRVAIQDGVNGLLCNNLDEWKDALYQLVTNQKLRQEMGHKAFEDVNSRYLTRVAATESMEKWKYLLGGSLSPNKPLSIAFILRAPIAQTGGGYKHIFNLAYYLAAKEHTVNIYIEPIAHLTNFTTEQVRDFCEENFGKSKAIIHCGHAGIVESDIAIATNWPTAYVVEQLVNTRFKAYYVQDYEPYFYKPGEANFTQAEATYNLPLNIITLGKYLAEILSQRNKIDYPYVDFPLGEVFLAENPILHRHLSTTKPCSILFFARPHIPRRNFALGVESLNKLHQHNSDVQIKLYGLEEALELPFPYENLGVLTQAETAEAMRSSDIHLSFSMTNISTVVFEAMACGCATVEVDVPPVRAMIKEGTCLLCEPNSQAVFNALMDLINNAGMRQNIATSGYESVKDLTLQNMCMKFEKILMEYSFRIKS